MTGTGGNRPQPGNLSPSIRVQITDGGDPVPNQQINNNSKSCICYGNAVVGTILFIFSFCSIVFIIIFVEYHEICDVPATTPILPSSATNLPALSERHFQDENNPFNPNQEDEEQKIQDDFLKAIENKSADDDQMSLDYDAEYEEEISYNITKLIATALQLEPDKVLHYMSRSEWQISDKATTDETGNLPTLRLPVKRIIVAHTGGKSCNSTFNCSRLIQTIQASHQLKWKEISYNFLIGGNGVVFEGRGWDKEGAHTPSHNANSLGVALIGSFNVNKPTDEQVRALRYLIEWGISSGKVDKEYKLFAHRQLHATDSPGTTVYEIIESWPHFSTVLT